MERHLTVRGLIIGILGLLVIRILNVCRSQNGSPSVADDLRHRPFDGRTEKARNSSFKR